MADHDLRFVHRWEPAPEGARGATLLVLHGTGGNENDLVPLARELAPGAAILSPRGKVLERGMPRFTLLNINTPHGPNKGFRVTV